MKIIQEFLREGAKCSLSKKSTSFTKTPIGIEKKPKWKKTHELKEPKWKKLHGEEHTLVDTPQGTCPKEIANHGQAAVQGFFDKQKRRAHFKVPG